MKNSIITLALISGFATPALAMTVYDDMPPTSGGIGGVGLGDLSGGYRFGGGGIAEQALPRVTITCGAMCRDQGVTIFHPNGTEKIFVGGSGPAAVSPVDRDSTGRELTPQEKDDQQKKCLDNCRTQDTVNQNNCKISNAQFAAKMASVPIWAAVGGGIIGGLIFKAPGAAGAFLGGGLLATADKDARVKDQLSFCLALVARDNNDCITKTCHAWFLAPLAMLRRRRE